MSGEGEGKSKDTSEVPLTTEDRLLALEQKSAASEVELGAVEEHFKDVIKDEVAKSKKLHPGQLARSS